MYGEEYYDEDEEDQAEDTKHKVGVLAEPKAKP